MLIQCSSSTITAVAEVALEAGAIPRCVCGDGRCVGIRVGEQFVRQQPTFVALTNGLEHCAVIDIRGSLA